MGLTTDQVKSLRSADGTSTGPLPTSRTYLRIVRDNVLTFINGVLFGLAIALAILGQTTDALISVGVVAVNMVVGLVQEIHAKRVLDRIAVLARPRITVVRDGLQQKVDPLDVVVGDLLIATAGDQIAADGVVVGQHAADVDEALLTGESDRLAKRKGDRVFAGTFCTAGTLEYAAGVLGPESTANKLATSARAFRRVLTPLQHEMNRVVRVSLVVVVFFEVLVALANALDRTSLIEGVRMAVVIAGLIPNGLFLAIAVAYSMGAMRMAGRGALVQQANAVESLSHVDVLCLDKTGTLTTNGFRLADVRALQGSEAEFLAELGAYAASSSDANRTLIALRDAAPAASLPVLNEVLFCSARKWSALTLATSTGARNYILGAADVLRPHLRAGLRDIERAWVSSGLRVLLLSQAPCVCQLDEAGESRLPDALEPLGLVALSDELREDAAATLAEFDAIGVQLILLSGDDPHAVAAVAQQAGIAFDTVISGSDLLRLGPDEVSELAAGGAIFGRLSPDQKEMLIRSLRARGHYVAMVGDGVNDVSGLKAADLAIAMQSGATAARAVSDIVLLRDQFGALPYALHEGQRIRGGMHAILKLFLTRVLYMALLIVMLGVVDIGFPFAPRQNALVTLLTVGLPTLALAAWARPLEPREQSSSVFRFVIPAACAVAILGLSVYTADLLLGPLLDGQWPIDAANSSSSRAVAQTALTAICTMCGLVLILFVQPHGERLTSWRAVNWKHAALALVLLAGFAVIAMVPRLQAIFDLQPLSPLAYVVLFLVVVLWAICLNFTWRWGVLDSLLGSTPTTPGPRTGKMRRLSNEIKYLPW